MLGHGHPLDINKYESNAELEIMRWRWKENFIKSISFNLVYGLQPVTAHNAIAKCMRLCISVCKKCVRARVYVCIPKASPNKLEMVPKLFLALC